MERAVLTLATGKPVYLGMAVNLARSFRWWHPHGEIRFSLATDMPDSVPRDLDWVEIIRLQPAQYGRGFSPKLHLDEMATADQTLFVDADCLCVGGLGPVFEKFRGKAISVLGGEISEGEWFGDVASLCKRFDISSLPKFNGGVYYLERGAECSSIYAKARSLEPQYDDIGLVRLRGSPNEELLMALAMALHGASGVPDDGTIMAELLNFQSGLVIDVLGGKAVLWNKPGHPHYRASWPLQEARPLLVHFLGSQTELYPYTRESLRLRKLVADKWPRWAASSYASCRCLLLERIPDLLRDVARPLYRKLFGTRPVKRSARV